MPAVKTPSLPREKLIDILYRTSSLSSGEELFVPATSKQQQSIIIRNLFQELKIMSEITPDSASTITITPAYRDNRFWVRLTNAQEPLSNIFVKSEDGRIIKQSLNAEESKIDIFGKEMG